MCTCERRGSVTKQRKKKRKIRRKRAHNRRRGRGDIPCRNGLAQRRTTQERKGDETRAMHSKGNTCQRGKHNGRKGTSANGKGKGKEGKTHQGAAALRNEGDKARQGEGNAPGWGNA
jgi:hypothetical protein